MVAKERATPSGPHARHHQERQGEIEGEERGMGWRLGDIETKEALVLK